MNFDEYDFSPGLVNVRKTQALEEVNIREIGNINKETYVASWLENNQISVPSTSSPTSEPIAEVVQHRPQIPPDISIYKKVKSSSASSSSACKTEKKITTLYPAGYNLSEAMNEKKTKKKPLKEGTLPPCITQSPNNTISTDAKTPEAININAAPPKEQVVEASKSIPLQQVSPDWQAVFDKTDEFCKNKSSRERIQSHMMLALGNCLCNKCNVTPPLELVEPEEEVFETSAAPSRKTPPPLMKTTDSLIQTVMTAPVNRSKGLRILEANKLPVLTHGQTVPSPQEDISRTNLHQEVQNKLVLRGFEKSKPVQSFGWPAIMRGNNVVIIHKKCTGKTFTYIPALCSFLMDQEGRYEGVPHNSKSPLIVVLTNNNSVAEDVYSAFSGMLMGNGLLANVWRPALPLSKKDIASYFGTKCTKSHRRNYQKLDILVTTIDTLIFLLHEKVIDLKRLCHLVVENISIILEKLQPRLKLVLDAVSSMLLNRNSYESVQFICTGEKWTRKLESFVSKLHNFPLIIIGSHMQAALYGRANFRLEYVSAASKPVKLTAHLKASNYSIYKCIVVCNIEDVASLEKHFAHKAVNFVTATDSMLPAQVVDIINSWKTTPSGQHSVLICTDVALRQYVTVSNATFLINYSLPPSWTLFSQRFSTLIGSYQCPLTTTFAQNKFYCQIVTYVDENSRITFPRLSNFFTQNAIKVPEMLAKYCEEEKTKAEDIKVAEDVKLCKVLLNFGTCEIHDCSERHVLSTSRDTALNMPINGEITCKLIQCKAMNRFYVRIMEYKDIAGVQHKLPDHASTITRILKEISVFEVASDVFIGSLYLYSGENAFHRCIVKSVVKFITVGDTITPNALEVEVFGIDTGDKLTVNVNKLYKMPESLVEIPGTCVEVYIAQIIPPFKESLWTRNANKALNMKLKCFNKSTICTGSIVLRINDSFWVNDLRFNETDNPFPHSLSILCFLREKRIYCESENSLANLYQLCKRGGLELPEYKIFKEVVVERPKLSQSEASWAHLWADELNSVFFSSAISSDCFYVRHAKFDSLLKKLEEDIASSVHLIRRKLDKDEILKDCYYCVTDEVSRNWSRVLLTDIKDDIASCFCVDYGDYIDAPTKNLRLLGNEFLTKLPFQAIECSLYGVKPSSDEIVLDAMYACSFEENSDFFKTYYSKIMSEDKSDTFSIPGRKKYKVILLDYYSGEASSLNNEVLKKGVAERNVQELIEDVKLPQTEEIPDVSSMEIQCTDEDLYDINPINSMLDEFEINSDDFDFYDNTDALQERQKEIEGRKQEQQLNSSGYLPIKAAFKVDEALLPKIDWYQSESCVYLEFVFIENDDYKINITRNRFLDFSSTYKGKKYSIKLNLFNTVKKQFVHESKTHFILVKFTKEKDITWTRLTKSEDKMVNIKYKIDRIVVDKEPEEENEMLVSGDINDSYFKGVVFTSDGKLEEFLSDYDSDSDYCEISED